jgi:microcystin-dependent protein
LSAAIPSATILAYAGDSTAIPAGFFLCNGGAISRTTYATLFSRIGTRYGPGNGTTTFNVPDLRDKILYGSFGGGLGGLPALVGTNSVTVSTTNLPAHTHDSSIPNHAHSVNIAHDHGLYIHPHTHTTGNIGSHTHSLAPYRAVSIGGGSEDETGAELTTIPSSELNEYPNTAASTAAGPVVNPSSISIFPPPFTGVNKTDGVSAGQEGKTTTPSGAAVVTSTSVGAGAPIDIRQAGLRVNFLIKT